jgi:O-antigen/teichoic acid export membrane protein
MTLKALDLRLTTAADPEIRASERGGGLTWIAKDSLPITVAEPAASSPMLASGSIAGSVDARITRAATTDARLSALHIAWKQWQVDALGFLDQAVVSGTSFITTVLISHWTSPDQLGLYAIGITVLLSMLAVQDSLISLPYTIQRHEPLSTPNEHAGSALTHCGLLAAFGVIILTLAAFALSARGLRPELMAMMWALAGVVPFALLREFGRRFAFAHLRMAPAFMLDAAVATIQLSALCWLGWAGWMSPATACAAIGGACAVASLVWLYTTRVEFVIRADQVRATMKQSWGLGKWLFALQITVSVHACSPYWLLALGAGTSATGVYAACMSIVLFANPLMIGIGNTVAPKAALALKEGGPSRLRREIIRVSLLLWAAMTLFCLVLFFVGEDVMRFLYHGEEYAGHGQTVLVLALALQALTVSMPVSMALQSMGRPQAVLWASGAGTVLTVVLGWLMLDWGPTGAAYAYLAGSLAGAVGRWIAFLAIVPRSAADRNAESGQEQAQSRAESVAAVP